MDYESVALVAAIIVFVAFIGIVTTRDQRAKRECLDRGYVDSVRVGWSPQFCVKRENGSDVVVRLDSLRGTR